MLWNKKTDEILIFDAKKVSVKGLISEEEVEERRTAIAQLHQYKEAIIDFKTKERVVKGAYAVIPRKARLPLSYEKFFDDEYRKKYGFGVYVFEILGEKEEVLRWM
ncbi:MAG: nuclease domain-containing protein [Candidatus Hydrothermales bacterium]